MSEPLVPGLLLAERYRLERVLGQGAMGQVWRCTDLRLEREVAVKLVASELRAGREQEVRLQREAKAAAILDHPGITAVFDAGEHGGWLYIVMQLLQGEDLQGVLERSPSGLPVQSALDLAAQIADALAAAHEGGVVHRDLKPANVMLVQRNRIKICDFGIAWQAGSEGVTRTGVLMGTPLYMSPEQWRGQRVDHRTDLYSLGCVLYSLLTGEPPYPATSLYALMTQHLTAEPPLLSSRRPEISGNIDALGVALLAKDPAARPADARAIQAALDRQSRTPVRVDGPPRDEAGMAVLRGPAVGGPAVTAAQVPRSSVPTSSPASRTATKAEAERAAQDIADPALRARALRRVAEAAIVGRPAATVEDPGPTRVAPPIDPDVALRHAVGPDARCRVMLQAARAAAGTEDAMTWLLTAAEEAGSVDTGTRADLLREITVALAPYDIDRAIYLANQIPGATVALRRDKEHAEIAVAAAVADPAGAERAARGLAGSTLRADTLARIAIALVERLPDTAEQIVRRIDARPQDRVVALTRLSAAFSARDPARAAALRRQADQELQSLGPQADRTRGAIVAALAKSDSTIAYYIAMEIRDTPLRDAALGTLVELLTEP